MDGHASMADMARAAAEAGLAQLCFTDHCDLLDENGRPNPAPFDWAAEDAAYGAALEAVDGRIDLRLGMELGEALEDPALAARLLAHRPLDFVIGSQHNLPGQADYYFQRFSSVPQCEALTASYLEQLIALSRHPALYDVIGHITYPMRYMRWRDGVPVEFDREGDRTGALLRSVIEQGRGIELNTSGYVNCGGAPMPHEAILRRYRAMGGEIVTVGSDAHVPERISQGLADGMALLRRCGFRYFTVYRDRTPEFLPL